MARQRTLQNQRPQWGAFARRHQRNPILTLNPFYAVPPKLIDTGKAEMPRIWTAEQEAFERDLTATAHGGFFHRRPIVCPFLPPPGSAETDRIDQVCRDLITDELREKGCRAQQISRYFAEQRRRKKQEEERRLAY